MKHDVFAADALFGPETGVADRRYVEVERPIRVQRWADLSVGTLCADWREMYDGDAEPVGRQSAANRLARR
jgi:hypothetical protein